MKFLIKLWNRLRDWPKTIRITVRDGDCQLLGSKYVAINSWNEVMKLGADFAEEIMLVTENENLDEVYWHYEEV